MKTMLNATRRRDALPGLLLIGLTAAAVVTMTAVGFRRLANPPADETTVRCAQAFAQQSFSFPGR